MVALRTLQPVQKAEGVAIALSGVLAGVENAQLTQVLQRQLKESRVVVVDTSELRLRSGVAPTFFSNALIRAGGWPAARLVLAGADPRLRAVLNKSGVARDVVCVDDLDRALDGAHRRPERVARRLHLDRDRRSIPRAAAFLTVATTAWRVSDRVADDARRVARELVENAVRHARTASVLQVSLDPAGLRIAVRDFRASEISSPRRRLALVSSLATTWGTIPRSDGKSVWALLGDVAADSQQAVVLSHSSGRPTTSAHSPS